MPRISAIRPSDVIADAPLAELAEGGDRGGSASRWVLHRRRPAEGWELGPSWPASAASSEGTAARPRRSWGTFAHWGTPANIVMRGGRSTEAFRPTALVSVTDCAQRPRQKRKCCHEPAAGRRALCRPTARSSGPAATAAVKAIAIDEDDREVDAMPPLELVVAIDRDPPQAEPSPGASPSSSSPARAGRSRNQPPRRATSTSTASTLAAQPATVSRAGAHSCTSSLETASTTSR